MSCFINREILVKEDHRDQQAPRWGSVFVFKEKCDHIIIYRTEVGDIVVRTLHYTLDWDVWVDPWPGSLCYYRFAQHVNGDRYLNWAPKAQASRGVWGHAPPGNVLDLNFLKDPFLGFCEVLINLTDFHKIGESSMDLHLYYSRRQFLLNTQELWINEQYE